MRRRSRVLCLFPVLLSVAVFSAGAGPQPPVRLIDPAIVEMSLPDAGGALERSAIEFNHSAHVDALKAEGCRACHKVDEKGIDPTLESLVGVEGRSALTDGYHDTCTGCHQRLTGEGRKAGPVTCGECHVRLEPGFPARVAPVVDPSLHARHVAAYPDDCAACHHVWDEAAEKLVHRENTEEACRGCHGEVAVEKKPSLRGAAHRGCVSCHLERADRNKETGPTRCEGCHDRTRLAAMERLEEIPRLKRGQPNSLWVKGAGAIRPMVAFNHESHEAQGASCSTCHHQRLKACADCHTLRSGEDGGGVILERAHHDRDSAKSCIGCHQVTAELDDCAGCHRDTTVATNSIRGCVTCHNGPPAAADGSRPELADGYPPAGELAALPAASDDLPEEVTIDLLADEYQASKFPHLKIIRRFDAGIRESSLARRFHGNTEVLCEGCHHHSPPGERPPKCSACHGDESAATVDRPSLKVAYHRQCVRCHQRLDVKAGCTDCHAAKEGQS